MNILKTLENDTLTLSLEGWLDTNTSAELAAEIEKIEEVKHLIFDFEKLEYISSAGLRQIAATARKCKAMDAQFTILNAGREVMSVFKLTGLDKKFNITEKQ